MIVDLNARTRLELASMVYSRWCQAYDKLKEVKALTWESAGKFCPKEDWNAYHLDMQFTAQKELDLATNLKDVICKLSPLVSEESK